MLLVPNSVSVTDLISGLYFVIFNLSMVLCPRPLRGPSGRGDFSCVPAFLPSLHWCEMLEGIEMKMLRQTKMSQLMTFLCLCAEEEI